MNGVINWALLSVPDSVFVASTGAPPPPVVLSTDRTLPRDALCTYDYSHLIKHMSWLERDAYVMKQCGNSMHFFRGPIPLAHSRQQDGGSPPDHELPAAYAMWRELAVLMSERAMRWGEEEFQYRMRRAAIMYEIQMEQVYNSLLETALDEIHRQDELLEMEKIAWKHR